LALAVALGGTGYAAVTLPKNSVGTAQLKRGAVVAEKVKAHSLVAGNFKPGELPAGPTGPQGAQGLAGAAGPAGPAGAQGNPATKLFATVTRNAAGGGVHLGASSGVQTLVRQGGGSGTYTLSFNQDVSRCAAVVSPGGATLMAGQATAQTTGGGGVTVRTFDSTGSPTDLDEFTLAVFC